MISNKYIRLVLSISIILFLGSVQAASISGQGSWETTLLARDLDGNNLTAEAYYDTEFNITWLADANIYTQLSAYETSGELTWTSATSLTNFYGTDGWRLPITYGEGLVAGYGPVDPASELSHLYYDVLGNASGALTNTGPFSNIQPSIYYSSTLYYTDGNPGIYAYCFVFSIGRQGLCDVGSNQHYAWYVKDDDIGAAVVPTPATFWLLGSGLITLISFAKRNKCRINL